MVLQWRRGFWGSSFAVSNSNGTLFLNLQSFGFSEHFAEHLQQNTGCSCCVDEYFPFLSKHIFKQLIEKTSVSDGRGIILSLQPLGEVSGLGTRCYWRAHCLQQVTQCTAAINTRTGAFHQNLPFQHQAEPCCHAGVGCELPMLL